MKLKSQVQLSLAVLITVLSIWAIFTGARAFNEKTDWSKIPDMSATQLILARDQLLKDVRTPTNAEEYFDFLLRFEKLRKSAAKFEFNNSRRWDLVSHGADQVAINACEQGFVTEWLRSNKLQSSIGAYAAAHPEVQAYMGTMPKIPNEAWKYQSFYRAMWYFFLLPLPLCVALYSLRIAENDGNILLEVFNWRFLLSSMIWMYGLPYYRNMDFRQQVRRCQQVASFILVSSMSCITASAKAPDKDGNENKSGGDHPTWHLDTATSWFSSYVGYNVKVFHVGPVQQEKMALTAPNHFYIGGFGSTPYSTEKGVEDGGYQFAISTGWKREWSKFDFNPDFTYVGLESLGRIHSHALQYSAQVSRPVHFGQDTLTPYFWPFLYRPIVGKTPVGGTFLRYGLSNNLPLGKWSLGTNAEILSDTGVFGNSSGWLATASASLSRKIGRLQFLTPVNYGLPLTHMTDGRKATITTGFQVSFSF